LTDCQANKFIHSLQAAVCVSVFVGLCIGSTPRRTGRVFQRRPGGDAVVYRACIHTYIMNSVHSPRQHPPPNNHRQTLSRTNAPYIRPPLAIKFVVESNPNPNFIVQWSMGADCRAAGVNLPVTLYHSVLTRRDRR